MCADPSPSTKCWLKIVRVCAVDAPAHECKSQAAGLELREPWVSCFLPQSASAHVYVHVRVCKHECIHACMIAYQTPLHMRCVYCLHVDGHEYVYVRVLVNICMFAEVCVYVNVVCMYM